MNILEYTNDPKVANQTNRETKAKYTQNLNDLIMREKRMPDVSCYVKDKEYWFHVSVPDAKVHGINYDVVLQFIPKTPKQQDDRMITGYDVKFFANDPGFIFYYAYAFNHENLIISELKTKLNSTCLTKAPEKTNPDLNIRFCKTIYLAYLTLEKLNLLDKEYIKLRHPSKLNLTFLSAKIRNDTHVRAKLDTDRKIKRTVKNVKKVITSTPTTIKNTVNRIIDGARNEPTTTTTKNVKNSTKTTKTTRTVGTARTVRTVGRSRKR